LKKGDAHFDKTLTFAKILREARMEAPIRMRRGADIKGSMRTIEEFSQL
jgi:hypothetical protein